MYVSCHWPRALEACVHTSVKADEGPRAHKCTSTQREGTAPVVKVPEEYVEAGCLMCVEQHSHAPPQRCTTRRRRATRAPWPRWSSPAAPWAAPPPAAGARGTWPRMRGTRAPSTSCCWGPLTRTRPPARAAGPRCTWRRATAGWRCGCMQSLVHAAVCLLLEPCHPAASCLTHCVSTCKIDISNRSTIVLRTAGAHAAAGC